MISQRKLYFVAQLPPPINGLTLISQRMLAHCVARNPNLSILRLNSERSANGRAINDRFARLSAMMRAYFTALIEMCVSRWRSHGDSVFYLTPSGGIGQILELPLIVIARLAGWRIILHHHSFAYFNRGSLLASLMFSVAGKQATHICLGNAMQDSLIGRYGPTKTVVVSNAAFVDMPKAGLPAAARSCKRLALGFLGNIEISKGILDFLETVRLLQISGVDVAVEIAGPFANEQTRRAVERSTRAIRNVRLWGKVAGERKEEFFLSIDALLFPTRYVNEAEPVTILECLARGVPVFAPPRGSIPDMLQAEMAFGLFAIETFPDAVAKFVAGANSQMLWPRLSAAARERFSAMNAEARASLERLLELA